MLEILNRWSHGLVLIPFMDALAETGCTQQWAMVRHVDFERESKTYGLNRGYFMSVLRLLEGIGWLGRPSAGIFPVLQEFAAHEAIPDGMLDLYEFPFDRYAVGEPVGSLARWLDKAGGDWGSVHDRMPDYLDGPLCIPLFLSLRKSLEAGGGADVQGKTTVLRDVHNLPDWGAIRHLFERAGWAARNGGQGKDIVLTPAGKYLWDRCPVTAALASYRPMFRQALTLLRENPAAVFAPTPDGHERHVDRTLNVVGSGFQHEKYFSALESMVIGIFDNLDFEEQPGCIADTGCGDGTLLRRIYSVIAEKTLRGRNLEAFPLALVGVDFNEKALDAARKTLAGLPGRMIKGDIGDPEGIVDAIRGLGIDPESVLHIRSFLDHDRPYSPPTDRKAVEAWRKIPIAGTHIDATGDLLEAAEVARSTVEHLERWSRCINRHGLLLLEVHAMFPEKTGKYLDESESAHFDVYHAMSRQYLLDARTFQACAAQNGLLSGPGSWLCFPLRLPFTRISVNHFKKKPFAIRRAGPDNVGSLPRIEEKGLNMPPQASAGMSGDCFALVENDVTLGLLWPSHDRLEKVDEILLAGAAREEHAAALLEFADQYHALDGIAPPESDRQAALERALASRPRSVHGQGQEALALWTRQAVSGVAFDRGADPRAAELALGRFAFRWMATVLQRLGAFAPEGTVTGLAELKKRAGIAGKYERYVDSLLYYMAEDGPLDLQEGSVSLEAGFDSYLLRDPVTELDAFERSFTRQYPHFTAALKLVRRGLERFGSVVTGKSDAAEMLFDAGSLEVFGNLFRGEPASDYFNQLGAKIVASAITRRLASSGGMVRVLEIGAGTGGATASVLAEPVLHDERVEYFFTDISQAFLRYAQRRFQDSPAAVRYMILDIDKEERNRDLLCVDVIVANNVLHDTRDICLTLRRVGGLLKPGGLLLLNEFTEVKRWLFATGALLHGMWLFEDQRRRLPGFCLSSRPQWEAALSEAGFCACVAHHLPTQTDRPGQCLFVAETPGSARQAEKTNEALSHAPGQDSDRENSSPSEDTDDRTVASQSMTAIRSGIESRLASILGQTRATDYAPDRPLMEMGLDSVELVELRSLLSEDFQVSLSPTFFFEFETVARIAEQLAQRAGGRRSRAAGDTTYDHSCSTVEPAPSGAGEQFASLAEQPTLGRIEKCLAPILGNERIDGYGPDRPLMEMGLDSVELVEFKSLLSEEFGTSLSPTFFFEHETASRIVDALQTMEAPRAPASERDGKAGAAAVHEPARKEGQHVPKQERNPATETNVTTRATGKAVDTHRRMAIVGMACRFPGGCESPSAFWNLLARGETALGVMPARWVWPSGIDPKNRHRGIDVFGFLPRIDEFDAGFFRISPREAELMDPQQRMLLELSWNVMEDAGWRPSELRKRSTGVFVGACHEDYRDIVCRYESPEPEPHRGMACASSLLANRISYFHGFTGPSLTVDTACSSALTALHHAAIALENGECDAALVGAVNLICSPMNSMAYYDAGMLSKSGACHAFDARADGFVRGEGAAMILLKSLEQALDDGDSIYALVAGTAVNHGGQASSLTAPRPDAQAGVIRRAWDKSGISGATVQYVETHGTGTVLGDPVEAAGLASALNDAGHDGGRCGLGAVKSNIGHLEGAAGLAGLLKVALALQNRMFPGQPDFSMKNPHIDFSASPLYVVDKNEPWPENHDRDGRPVARRAGLSAFGFGGANAHAVLEEYPGCCFQKNASAFSGDREVVVLSARTGQQLRERMESLVRYLDYAPGTSLHDLAHTLQTGREPMDVRFGATVGGLDELRAKLLRTLDGWEEARGLDWTDSTCRATAPAKGSGITDASADVEEVLELWLGGGDIRPNPNHSLLRRLHLPTYPFEKHRFWLASSQVQNMVDGSGMPSTLPVSPVSDARGHGPTIMLTGDEWFLRDHIVQGRKLVPGVVQLEWARAAAAVYFEKGLPVQLEQVAWLRPLEVDGPVQVRIALRPEQESRVHYAVYRKMENGEEEIASQGYALPMPDQDSRRLDLDGLLFGSEVLVEADDIYRRLSGFGLTYGQGLRSLGQIRRCGSGLLGRLRRTPGTDGGFLWPPELLDGALQSSLFLDGSGLALPFALDSIRILSEMAGPAWAVTRPRGSGDRARDILDLDIIDDGGQVMAELRGVCLRAPNGKSAPSLKLWSPEWTPQPAPSGTGVPEPKRDVVLCGLDLSQPGDGSAAWRSIHSDKHSLAERYAEYTEQLLDHIRTVLSSKIDAPSLLQIVVPLEGQNSLLGGLNGLLRTVEQEYTGVRCQLIAVASTRNLVPILEAEALGGDFFIRYGGECREVLCYREALRREDSSKEWPSPWKDNGVYWITGGLGGLGRLFALEAARQARQPALILTGRRIDPGYEAFVEELRSLGARVETCSLDVTEAEGVRALAVRIVEKYNGLNGIIHCAGVVADSLIRHKSAASLREVLSAKAAGLENLDEATAGIALDWIAACSSISSVLGNIGQADYAAANGFMDAYVRYRAGLAAGLHYGRLVSINWPLWADGGMRPDRSTVIRMDLAPMPSRVGMDAFAKALSQSSGRIMVTYGDTLPPNFGQQEATVWRDERAKANSTHSGNGAFLSAELPVLERTLARLVASQLKLPLEAVDSDTPLGELGFDSISLTSFSQKLNDSYGLRLSPSVFFEAPTVAALAGYLAKEHRDLVAKSFSLPGHAPLAPEPPEPSELSEQAGTDFSRAAREGAAGHRSEPRTFPVHHAKNDPFPAQEPIAVIGMSGAFPGAPDLDALWRNLVNGVHSISELPPSRWGSGEPPRLRHAGVLDELELFDPLFFGISPLEARAMDPQQRLLMQHVYWTLEDAGYSAKSLSGSRTALLTGMGVSGYAELLARSGQEVNGLSTAGLVASMGPNRMSYWLNWHGPSEPVDTACSSSLVAIHRAIGLLRRGECEQAIAGGVNALLWMDSFESFRHAGMLSPGGRCRTFSAVADGYVRGEGIGMLMLKPLSVAERDGDHIYGLLVGSAQNHGGKANSLTAPNPEAQARLIEAAFLDGGVDPDTVGYVEAHGTGTALGDPIEVEGLKRAFGALYGSRKPRPSSCGLGSIKSNIGHLEYAAGVAGVIKVLLQMRHRTLAPSLNSEPRNPLIDFSGSPFHVIDQAVPWDVSRDAQGGVLPRRAGVSSFGFGGVNTHVVLQEYSPADADGIRTSGPSAVVLSARDNEKLLEQANRLFSALKANPGYSLADVAHTLQVGRDHHICRLAIMADSREDLLGKLEKIGAGEDSPAGVYRGEAARGATALSQLSADADFRHTVGRWAAQGKTAMLADMWTQGLDVDWSGLYGAAKPGRCSLPGYPFARERYWIDCDRPGFENRARQILHPLVHANTSNLARQRFSTLLTGGEWFIRDHLVAGRGVVPGAVQLEWARAAAALSMDGPETAVCLREVAWLHPLDASVTGEVHIDLEPREDGSVFFSLYREEEAQTARIVFSRGIAARQQESEAPAHDLDDLKARCILSRDPENRYARFSALGLDYGPGLRVVGEYWTGEDISLARLELPSDRADDGFFWPPSLLDGGLQAGFDMETSGLLLPFSVESAVSWSPVCSPAWAVIRRPGGRSASGLTMDVDITSDDGRVMLRLSGVYMRSPGGEQDKAVSNRIEEPRPVRPEKPSRPGNDDVAYSIERMLISLISGHLQLPESSVDRDTPFTEFGFDSITLTSFSQVINDRCGLRLGASVFFEAPTVTELGAYLMREHGAELEVFFAEPPDSGTNSASRDEDENRTPADSRFAVPAGRFAKSSRSGDTGAALEPIAVIGMSCGFPGAANVGMLWDNLAGGRDCIGELPPSRWAGGEPPVLRHAGVMKDVELFDSLFFGISPREARAMDPQQRLLMQYVYLAVEDAGYAPRSLSGSMTALIVGTGSSGYAQMLARAGERVTGFSAAALVGSMGPNRMSYWLNWQGPSEPVETACSSSLVAIHRAVGLLRRGECEQAVVGGVNTLLSMDMHESFRQAGMLSPDGRCRSFSAAANGYVRGEGAGMLMLKPLSAAERDGDHIYGLIAGSAENHGGRANSLTAPNPAAQARVIEAALRDAAWTLPM